MFSVISMYYLNLNLAYESLSATFDALHVSLDEGKCSQWFKRARKELSWALSYTTYYIKNHLYFSYNRSPRHLQELTIIKNSFQEFN